MIATFWPIRHTYNDFTDLFAFVCMESSVFTSDDSTALDIYSNFDYSECYEAKQKSTKKTSPNKNQRSNQKQKSSEKAIRTKNLKNEIVSLFLFLVRHFERRMFDMRSWMNHRWFAIYATLIKVVWWCGRARPPFNWNFYSRRASVRTWLTWNDIRIWLNGM